MCLLITGKSDAIRNTLLETPGLIEDIYAHNPDGLGLMWPENGKVAIIKALPRSVEEVKKLLEAVPKPEDTREPIPVAIHFRMRTHGNIDIDNCHPYQINAHAWLMHNGVLDTGNHKDKSKSDTWHFVQDYLTTMPVDVLHNPQYLALLGYTIGHNTFAIMSDDGRLSEVNRHLGIEVGGLWFSNTYAWDAGILIPEYRSRRFMWGDLDPVGAPSQISYPEDFFDPDALLQSVEDYSVNDVAYYLERTPSEAIDCILNYYKIEVAKSAYKECTKDTLDICKAWEKGDEAFLSLQAMQDPDKTAEALLYYCNFDYKPFDPLHERNALRGNLLVSWKK